MTYLYVSPLQCRLKPEICRLKPVTCRTAQEHSRHELVTDCRPEPPCVVTDIPKRAYDFNLNLHPVCAVNALLNNEQILDHFFSISCACD